ncbi:MAG: PorT family protein [Bacteroidales bacterium]|nr:PorT family protein [Bacteroidales bacterium]
MKKIVEVTLMLCLLVPVSAQITQKKMLNYQQHDNRVIHFGFCLGLNAMDFNITPSLSDYKTDTLLSNVTKLSPGFHIQAVSALKLSKKLELRFLPGVAFGSRNLLFFKPGKLYDDNHQLESSYVELPLLLKYKSERATNMRGFIIGGLNPRLDLAKTYREDDGIYMDLKFNDLCYELGGGFDFYFPYFKLTFEIRGSWGIFNVLNEKSTPHPEFQNAIEKLRSSAYMFSIYIE